MHDKILNARVKRQRAIENNASIVCMDVSGTDDDDDGNDERSATIHETIIKLINKQLSVEYSSEWVTMTNVLPLLILPPDDWVGGWMDC